MRKVFKKSMVLNSRQDAFTLLEKLGAPEHLLTHVTLVGEAADLLLEKCKALKSYCRF